MTLAAAVRHLSLAAVLAACASIPGIEAVDVCVCAA